MSTGEIALEGLAADLRTSDEVKNVYLGGAD
jgi:ABC-type lipopolysaccharide export system ATPase subunit